MAIINMVYLAKEEGWWKPWANTVIYYEFDWNLNDGSWNGYNLTNSWTTFITLASWKQVLSVEQASASYSWWPNLTWKSLTASFWFADTATRSWYSDWSYFRLANWNSNIFVVRHAWPIQSNKIYFWATSRSNWNDAPSYNDLARHYVVITFDTSTQQLKEYIDNSLKATTTYTGTAFSTITNIIIGWLGFEGQVHFNLSEFILEDKVRTAQEISDYYNQTKWDYWL